MSEFAIKYNRFYSGIASATILHTLTPLARAPCGFVVALCLVFPDMVVVVTDTLSTAACAARVIGVPAFFAIRRAGVVMGILRVVRTRTVAVIIF